MQEGLSVSNEGKEREREFGVVVVRIFQHTEHQSETSMSTN